MSRIARASPKVPSDNCHTAKECVGLLLSNNLNGMAYYCRPLRALDYGLSQEVNSFVLIAIDRATGRNPGGGETVQRTT